MSEKVFITANQAEALDWLTNDKPGSWTHEELIKEHAKDPNGWSGDDNLVDLSVLNGLPLLTIIDALRVGYDVKKEYKVGDFVLSRDGYIGEIERVVGNQFYGKWINSDKEYPMDCTEKSFFGHADTRRIRAEKEREEYGWGLNGKSESSRMATSYSEKTQVHHS